jgi:hypothetical protein
MSDRSPTYMVDSCMPIENVHAQRQLAKPVEPVTALPCIRSWISRGAAVHAVCGYQRLLPLSMLYRLFWPQSSQVWPTRASIPFFSESSHSSSHLGLVSRPTSAHGRPIPSKPPSRAPSPSPHPFKGRWCKRLRLLELGSVYACEFVVPKLRANIRGITMPRPPLRLNAVTKATQPPSGHQINRWCTSRQ